MRFTQTGLRMLTYPNFFALFMGSAIGLTIPLLVLFWGVKETLIVVFVLLPTAGLCAPILAERRHEIKGCRVGTLPLAWTLVPAVYQLLGFSYARYPGRGGQSPRRDGALPARVGKSGCLCFAR